MHSAITLRWKVVSLLRQPFTQSVAFNVSPNVGLSSRLGIAPERAYVPTLLSPTITYHQVIRNTLSRERGVRLDTARFPYRMHVARLGCDVSFAVRTKLFPPATVLLDVELDDIGAPDRLDELISWQRLENLRPISDVVRWTIGMIASGNHRRFDPAPSFRFKPAIHVHGMSTRAKFRDDVERRFRELSGILIRNQDYAGMDDGIAKDIATKNAELNRKSVNELLLVDKQGILYVTPTEDSGDGRGRSSFMQVLDLQEIAMAFAEFLKAFRSIRRLNEDFADFLLSRIVPWIRNAGAVFSPTRTGLNAWRLFVAEFSLDAQLDLALTEDVRADLAEKQPYFDRLGHEWWRDPEFGETLNHRIQASRELPLGFLGNPDLTRLISEDYAEAKRSLQARNYKSAVLLCGAILEAMLTAALITAGRPGLTTDKLYREYTLNTLIEECTRAGLLGSEPLKGLLHPLRHYRNMIHPGVQIRKSLEPDAEIARISVETVKLLARHLGTAGSTP